MIDQIKNTVLQSKITVIASRPMSGRVNMLLYLLDSFGIKQSETIKLYNLVDSSIWYTMKMISFVSGISYDIVHQCFYPCHYAGKGKNNSIDKELFMGAIEKLQKSNIYMYDFDYVLENDIIEQILEQETDRKTNQFIVINNFEELVKQSKYDAKELLSQLYDYAKYEEVHIILMENVKREAEEQASYDMSYIDSYQELKGFVDSFILTRRIDYQNEIELNIYTRDNEDTYHFKYNKENYRVEE